MATLGKYFAVGTEKGSKEKIKKSLVNVGDGHFTRFEMYRMEFKGHIDVPKIYNGRLNLSVDLTDKESSAPAGSCSVDINGASDQNAKYSATKDKLILTCHLDGKEETVAFRRTRRGKETRLDLSGYRGITDVHLVPVKK